jgi:stage III sporulation protein AE
MKRIRLTARRGRRALLKIFIILLILYTCVLNARALDIHEYFDTQAQLDALGVNEIAELLPTQTRNLMEDGGFRELSVQSLLHLSPSAFFAAIWRAFLEELYRPMRIFAALLGMTLLCALLGGLRDDMRNSSMREVFGAVTVLCMISSAAAPILDCIISTVDTIRNASIFMLGYIPVFSAAVIAAGQPITGTAYNGFLFMVAQIVSQVVSQTLLPLLSLYLALCIAGGLAPELGISSMCKGIKKIVTWALGFIITIFVGVLSAQTMVAGSADSLTVRTGKFLVGSFVPVVGSTLSEAMLAAQGCLRLIKTSVGAFGILASLGLFLPVFLQVVAWYFVTNAAAAASDLLGVKEVGGVLKSCSGALSIMMTLLLSYALLMIVTITVVIVTGLGL